MPADSDPLESLLEVLTPDVARLVTAARDFVRDVHPEVVQVAWPNGKMAGFGVGPKKYSEQYAYITTYRSHINLGFYYGSDLSDEHGLLGAGGKRMRSKRIEDVKDLQHPGVRELVEQARHHLPNLEMPSG